MFTLGRLVWDDTYIWKEDTYMKDMYSMEYTRWSVLGGVYSVECTWSSVLGGVYSVEFTPPTLKRRPDRTPRWKPTSVPSSTSSRTTGNTNGRVRLQQCKERQHGLHTFRTQLRLPPTHPGNFSLPSAKSFITLRAWTSKSRHQRPR